MLSLWKTGFTNNGALLLFYLLHATLECVNVDFDSKKRLFSVHNVFTIKSESEKIEHDVKYVLSIVI